MGKRVRTREQRMAELDEAMERLDEGVRAVFESGKWERYLEVMSRFRRYSANNSPLIAMQMPNATAVASYTDWKRKFGQQVRKGEHGIRILAPVRYRRKVEDESGDEAVVERLAGFRLVSTFGVSQTEGEPLPQIAELLDGSVARYEQLMGAIEAASPVPAGFEEMPEVVNGFFSRAERRIAIRPGMSQAQTVKTAIHELARSRMHDFDGVTPTEDLPDRGTREGRPSRWRSWRPATTSSTPAALWASPWTYAASAGTPARERAAKTFRVAVPMVATRKLEPSWVSLSPCALREPRRPASHKARRRGGPGD